MAEPDILDLEDKARLEFTLNTRKALIDKLIGKTCEVPENSADKALLVSALDGIDRTVLAKTKIKSDERSAKGQQQTAQMISELLLRVHHTTSGPRVEPLAENDYKLDDLVAGETDIGEQALNYETFSKQIAGK